MRVGCKGFKGLPGRLLILEWGGLGVGGLCRIGVRYESFVIKG